MHQSQEIDREEGRNTSWKDSSGIYIYGTGGLKKDDVLDRTKW